MTYPKTSTTFNSGTVVSSSWLNWINQKNNEVLSITEYEVEADGTDSYTQIAQALSDLQTAGGGKLIFPFSGLLGYGISETLQIPDNVTLEFQGSFLKILNTTTYDAALIGVPGARNITIINPLIDANNIGGACGIIARRNNPEIRIVGGLIKNCKQDVTRKGGRALNIEAGVDPSSYGPRNLTCVGLIAQDCYEALSVSGGASPQQESNIRVDMIAENCESAISLFGNTSNYPHNAEEMGAHITMTARNCGKAATYSRVHGVVNSDRGCNAVINIQVNNDSSYGSVGSFWRGDASNIVFNGTMYGECSRALLDFSSYQELDSVDEDSTFTTSGNTLSSLDSKFTIKHYGTVADIFNLPVVSANFLSNCQFDLTTDVVTSGKPGNTNTANKANSWARIQNKTQNAIVSGYLQDIDQLTFAQVNGLDYDASKQGVKSWATFAGATGTVNRGFNCSVSRVSTGVYDITFSAKPPNGITSYFICPASQASVASNQVDDYSNITNSGFRLTTYSGGAVADKNLIGFCVFW